MACTGPLKNLEIVIYNCPKGLPFEKIAELESMFVKVYVLPDGNFQDIINFDTCARWLVFSVPEVIQNLNLITKICTGLHASNVNVAVGYPQVISSGADENKKGFQTDSLEGFKFETDFQMSIELSMSPLFVLDVKVYRLIGGKEFSIADLIARLRGAGYRGMFFPALKSLSLQDTEFPAPMFYENLQNISKLHFGALHQRLDDPRLVLDARGLQPHFNGTSKYILSLLKEFDRSFQSGIQILVQRESSAYHNLEATYSRFILKYSIEELAPSDHGVILSQPFYEEQVTSIKSKCITISCVIFDIIAVDIEIEVADLANNLWFKLPDLVDHIFFISEYSKDIYIERYGCDVSYSVVPLSLDPTEYIIPEITDFKDLECAAAKSDAKKVLVVGNDLTHKNRALTVNNLESCGLFEVFQIRNGPGYGFLSDNEVANLYIQSDAVVFPSLYEGFGIPIMEALAYKRPCHLPNNLHNQRFQAIFPDNIFLYETFTDLFINLLADEKQIEFVPSVNWRWEDVLHAMQKSITNTLRQTSLRKISRWLLN